jgi:hypothetical protein
MPLADLGLRRRDGPARHDHRDRLPVYFADTHSPWERGSNEILNRIFREFFPKGVTITSDHDYLAMVDSEINEPPPQDTEAEEALQAIHRACRVECFHWLNSPFRCLDTTVS